MEDELLELVELLLELDAALLLDELLLELELDELPLSGGTGTPQAVKLAKRIAVQIGLNNVAGAGRYFNKGM